jgi:CheY-like chemotaxis protein
MAERLATLGQLAAGVAHEISNPAAYALTNLEELGARLKKLKLQLGTAELPHEAPVFETLSRIEEMVTDSLDGVSKISAIVSELQQFTHTRAGTTTWTDLAEVARAAVQLTRNRVRHRCNLITNVLPTSRFVADQVKLVQIAINLIDNASRVLEPHDTLRVTTGSDTTSGDSWLIVEDNGPGVPEALRERIFEPFFSTRSEREGAGLGLTLSLEYAERHRGTLVLEQSEHGARFVLKIPEDTGLAPPLSRAPRHSETRPKVPYHVLLVDDEPALLRAFRRVLESKYRVTIATSGQNALDALSTEAEFDAVICDINMPGIDGAEFYRSLVQEHPQLAPRVVFCSGGIFDETTLEFVESTHNPVLNKPIAPSTLLDAVSSFLDERRSA